MSPRTADRRPPARVVAGLALAVLTLAACGGSAARPAAARPELPPLASLSPAAIPASVETPIPTASPSGPSAESVRQGALRATAALRSYAFTSVETVTSKGTPQVTRVQGRAVRPDAVSYTQTGSGPASQVTTIGAKAYVKTGTGPVKPGRRTGPATDPLATLTATLTSGTAPTLDGARLHLRLAPADAVTAHLISVRPSAPVDVVMTVDAAGRVVGVDTTVRVGAGGRAVAVTIVTTYAGFDTQAPITPPR